MRVTAALVASFVLAGLSIADPAAAAIRRQTNIPAQALGPALQTLAAEREMQVLYRTEIVGDRETAGAAGEFTLDEVLTRLLSGTGLIFKYLDDKTITILPAASPAGERPGAPQSGQRTHPTFGSSDSGDRGRLRLAQTGTETIAGHAEGPGSHSARADEISVGIPEILVRGSPSLNMDIERTRDDAQPYVVLDRAAIQKTGASSIEDLLRTKLSMNTSGIASSQGGPSNESNISLRGLGTDETLILIDGRRAPAHVSSGAPGQPDLNGIPVAAIERIEILPTTASGIYGGSATGGVINVVLRRDYTGADVGLTYENTFRADAAGRRVDLSSGWSLDDGHTNLYLSGSYYNADSMTLSDRDFIQRARARILQNNPAALLASLNPPLGATTNIRSSTGAPLFGLGTPSFTSVPAGYAGGGGLAPLQSNSGQYNLDPAHTAQLNGGGERSLLNEPTLKSVMGTVRHQVSASLEAFLDVAASENSGSFVLSGPVPTSYLINANAPNNPFGQAIRVTVPVAEGSSDSQSTERVSRFVGGVIYKLPADWSASADYTWSKSRVNAESGPSVGLSAAARTAIATGSIDVLRDTTTNPIDFSAYVIPPATFTTASSTLKDTVARVAGPVSLGSFLTATLTTMLEHREEAVDDSFQTASDVVTLQPVTTLFPAKSQRVDSVYLELRVPLVSPSASVPGLRSLEVQFAGRHDRYTTDGTLDSVTAGTAVPSARNHISSTDPTVAVRLQPVEDVTFRASYGTGFLPPSVTQLVATPIVSQTAVTDPRRGNEQVLLSGSQVLTGGNAALAPEDSKSWSVGTILTPGFAPGLRAAVDYVSIEKHNVIMNPFIDIQDVVNNELLIPNHVTRAAPAANDPSGVGAIVGIARTLTNVERADVKAIDTALDYRLAQTRFGSFDFDAVATWQTHYKRQLKPGGPTQDLVGISQSNPLKFRMNAALSWERGPWTAGWATRYYDSYRVADPSQTFNATMILNQGHGGRVSSQIYHDAFLGYRFADSAHAGFLHVLTGVHVQLTAKNVFDKSPPFDASDMVRYYSPFGDPRLSSYSLSLRKTF